MRIVETLCHLKEGSFGFSRILRINTETWIRAGLANHLRTMSQPDFILLLQKIYRSLLNGIEGLQAQGVIIVDVLSTLGYAESRFMKTTRERSHIP